MGLKVDFELSIQSEKVSKDKTLNSLNSEIKHLEEERASIRKDASEIRAQKTKFMDEVNAYNKSKSEIETKLSYERRKFDEADSLIKTSTNRLTEIDKNLPNHKINLENLQIQKSFSESQITHFKNKKIISRGWTSKFGSNHAEINALKSIDKEIKDLTMYVTMEPCHHYGKTPPQFFHT